MVGSDYGQDYGEFVYAPASIPQGGGEQTPHGGGAAGNGNGNEGEGGAGMYTYMPTQVMLVNGMMGMAMLPVAVPNVPMDDLAAADVGQGAHAAQEWAPG